MNYLLDALIDPDSPDYYSAEVFAMDFSEYFLPSDTETQAKLRDHAANATYWYALLAEGVDDPEQTRNRSDAFNTQALAVAMIVLKSLWSSTAHGEDNE